MSRARILYLFLGLMAMIIIIIWLRPATTCQVLDFDQHDGVGTFVSPEIAPARIRARGGEEITWVLRNPSNRDITVSLIEVNEPPSTVNILREVFADAGGAVTIGKHCRIAPLQARLQYHLLEAGKRGEPCDSSRVFHYFFNIRVHPSGTSKGDSVVCEWPYDPEVVVERDP
ncbi:MAG: hypothetical protein FD129_1396 [bacterium]|nr:MAG: hypothetical protein FD129_1396 [bacterium]